MKKKVVIVFFIMISIFLVSCSMEKSTGKGDGDTQGMPPPSPPIVELESLEELIDCVTMGELTVKSGDLTYGFNDYECLVKMKEEGKIPVLMNAADEIILQRIDGVKIYPPMSEYEQFDYGGFVDEERIGVSIIYLNKEHMEISENVTAAQLYAHNPHSSAFENMYDCYDIYTKDKQLLDRTVEVLLYDGLSGVNNYAYFVYDDMLIELGSKSEIVIDDNDFFSQIKIGYIEIE